MKLVQKTILATAVAVAFSPAAFADVTLSGKVAAELVGIVNDGGVKDASGADMVSDGLEIDIAGEYDIVGGNTAGFAIDTTLNSNTWGGQRAWGVTFDNNGNATGTSRSADTSFNYDLAHVFIDTNFGKFSFGRLTQPANNIRTDYWSNSRVAGAQDRAYNAAGAITTQGFSDNVGNDMSNTILYTNGNDMFDFGFSASAVDRDSASNHVERGNQLQYSVAVGVNVGPAKLELGVNHDPERTFATTQNLNTQADTAVILGADLENFTATITSAKDSSDNNVTSLMLGAKHAFTDVVTGKATASALSYKNTANRAVTNYKVAVGADYNLAKNIVAHTVVDFKEVDGWNETQIDLATGITVNF